MPASRRFPRKSPGAFVAPLLALLCSLSAPAPTAAQVVDPDLWGVDGGVEAIVRIHDTLYLGGGFVTVGPCTGGGVPVDRATGAPRTPFPRVLGRVSAVVTDGAGGWFLGGHFGSIEGVPRQHLAHVLADGSLAPWNPAVVGEERLIHDALLRRRPAGVSALALRGGTLYVGGNFTSVDGTPRNNLAAFDVATGALTAWDPNADNEVRCVVVQGNTIYAGGEFKTVGGLERHFIAALDARTGRPTPWNPEAEQRVRALAVDGRTVYAGGDFQAIGGRPRNCIAALDAATGQATPWDVGLAPQRKPLPHSDWIWPFVSALAVHGRTVYASGFFDSAGAQPRLNMAAFDARSGAVTGFAPNPSSWALAIVPAGNVVYVGGDWYFMGDAAVPHVAALDAVTGRPTAWSPRANGLVEALAVDPTTVYVGGGFTSMHDWVLRNGLAALDLTTGRVTDWDPHMDGYDIRCMTAVGDTLYMAGAFKGMGGQVRGNIAAVDANTGAVTSWVPGSFGMGGPLVRAQGRLVYVVGRGTHPPYFAKLDPVTAEAEPFDAQLDGGPADFVEIHGTIYLAGNFVHVGGQFRPYLAAVDATTAELLPWNPYANPAQLVMPGVAVLAARGNTVYLGGNFWGTDFFPRRDLAAVDGTTGALLPWNPKPTGDDDWSQDTQVLKLMVRGDEVWVGGNFKVIGGEPRLNLAVLDAVSGVPSPLALDPDSPVYEIVSHGDTVYVGGGFTSVGGLPHCGVAAIVMPGALDLHAATATTTSPATPVALSLGPCRPNPLRGDGVIGFTLPRGGPVSLAVYDLRGRRVATPLDGQPQAAGAHEVPVSTAGWGAGVYFCRIESRGLVATRKLVVAP